MKKPLLLQEQPARRGFLRKLAMAPAAALATHKLILPAEALATPGDASARLQHHLEGLQRAFNDLYPQGEITSWGHVPGTDALVHVQSLVRGDLAGAHTISLRTKPLDGITALVDVGMKARGIR